MPTTRKAGGTTRKAASRTRGTARLKRIDGGKNAAVQRAKEEQSGEVDVVDALHSLDDKFLDCRDIRHPWRRMGFFRRGTLIARQLACPRCGTTREDVWSAAGERISHRYIYPDGYQLRGTGGVAPIHIRVEAIARANIYDNEESLVADLFGNRRRRAN